MLWKCLGEKHILPHVTDLDELKLAKVSVNEDGGLSRWTMGHVCVCRSKSMPRRRFYSMRVVNLVHPRQRLHLHPHHWSKPSKVVALLLSNRKSSCQNETTMTKNNSMPHHHRKQKRWLRRRNQDPQVAKQRQLLNQSTTRRKTSKERYRSVLTTHAKPNSGMAAVWFRSRCVPMHLFLGDRQNTSGQCCCFDRQRGSTGPWKRSTEHSSITSETTDRNRARTDGTGGSICQSPSPSETREETGSVSTGT